MPSARKRRQVSKPSTPGIITSSTTASYAVVRTIRSACVTLDGDIDDEPLEAQATADRRGHPYVVLHDQNFTNP